MLMRFLFGDDIFISYSRRDGAKYAAALANELSKRGNDYSCFLDQWGASAANELSKPVLHALRRSSVLVLIGTAGAVGSPMVQLEIKMFSQKRRLRSARPILPISIDGALNALSWTELTGLNRIPETDEARSDGVPSESVIRLVANSHSYTKRAQRTRWLSMAALILLISSIVVGSLAGYQAKRANDETQRANNEAVRANTEKQRANEQAQAAKVQEEEALKSKARADKEAENARNSAKEAERQQLIASEKAREAEQQALAAKENAKTARSQELAAHAKAISSEDPRAAVLEAIDAISLKPTAEAEDALRKTLLRFPEQTILEEKLAVSKNSTLSAKFSPDDRFVVTTSLDGVVRVWDVSSGKLISTITDDQVPLFTAAISPNGKYLVASGMNIHMMGKRFGKGEDTGENELILITAFPSGEIIHSLRDGSGVSITFTRDSQLAIISSGITRMDFLPTWIGTEPVVLDLQSGKTIKLPEKLVVGEAMVTPDNKILFAGSKRFAEPTVQIQILDADMRKVTTIVSAENSPGPAKLVSSPAGDRAVALLEASTLIINPRTGEILATIRRSFRDAQLTQNGQVLIACENNGTVHLYDASTGESFASFQGHPTSISGLRLTADDQLLLVAGGDNILRVWKRRPLQRDPVSTSFGNSTTKLEAKPKHPFGTFEQVAELTGHASNITTVKISNSGNFIVTGDMNGTARVWKAATIGPLETQLAKIDETPRFWKAALSPLGDYFVTLDGESAHLWNGKTGAHVAVLVSDDRSTTSESEIPLRDAVFSSDGKLIIVTRFAKFGLKSSELYDSSGAFLGHVPGSLSVARGAAFSPDNKFIAIVANKQGAIWSVAEKKIVKELGAPGGIASITFSPNGKLLITAGTDGVAQLWSFPDGKELDRVQFHVEEPYEVPLDDAVFSPNGRYAIVRNEYRTQWLWDITAQKTMKLAKLDVGLLRVGFSNDSTLVFTTDASGKTLIHNTGDGKLKTSIPAAALSFSDNGKFVIDDRLQVWETTGGRLFSKPGFAAEAIQGSAIPMKADDPDQFIAITSEGTIVRLPLKETTSLSRLLSIAFKRIGKPSF